MIRRSARRWFVVFVFALASLPAGRATGESWLQSIDDSSGTLTARVIVPAVGGGFVVAGGATAAFQVAPDGSLVWEALHTGDNTTLIYDAVELSDGSTVVVGLSQHELGPDKGAWVARLDTGGSLLWSRRLDVPGAAGASGVTRLADDSVVVVGRNRPPPGGNSQEALAFRVSSAGDLLWERTYVHPDGEPVADWLHAVTVLADGTILAAGTTDLLLQIDAEGSIIDARGTRPPIALGSVVTVPDGGFLIAALADVLPAPGAPWRPWAALIDSDWNIVWQNGWVGVDTEGWAWAPIVVPDGAGDYYLGATWHDSEGVWNGVLARLSRAGELTQPIAFESPRDLVLSDLAVDSDGSLGFVTYRFGNQGVDGWLGRLESLDDPFIATCSPPFGTTPAAPHPRDFSFRERPLVESTSMSTWVTAGLYERADRLLFCAPCGGISCDPIEQEEITVTPSPACDRSELTLTVSATGGEGSLLVEWDLDDDGWVDRTGNPLVRTFDPGTWPITALVSDQCASCEPQLLRSEIVVEVGETPVAGIALSGPAQYCGAAGEALTLSVPSGFAAYQWTLEGADLPGATAAQLLVTAPGEHAVRISDAVGCESTTAVVVVVPEACPPGEVSAVLAGEPALEFRGDQPGLRVESEGLAAAYNVYEDALGSWFTATPRVPSRCHVDAWTDLGDGTIGLALEPAPGNWVLISASNSWGEGPAGHSSRGEDRRLGPPWTECGETP